MCPDFSLDNICEKAIGQEITFGNEKVGKEQVQILNTDFEQEVLERDLGSKD